MQNLWSEDIAFPIGGIADGTVSPLRDNLYLLDGAGNVISSRAVRKIPATGTNFWRELDTMRGELNALCRTLLRGTKSNYLMQCGPVPVLVIRYPYAADLSLLAVIPEGEMAQVLRTPAAYDGCLYDELQFSPLSASKRMPYDAEICHQVRRWLLPYMCAIGNDGARNEKSYALMQILIARTFRLAHLCGVRAQYDFSAIGYATVEGVNYSLLTAQLIAVMFLAMRAAKDKRVGFSLERAGCAAPVLYARMYLENAADPLPELASLYHTAASRGLLFEAGFDPARRGLLHLKFEFCAEELSVQQLRAYLDFGN